MKLIVAPKARVETLALLLHDNNTEQRKCWQQRMEKKKITYFFNGQGCCYDFFIRAYGINKNICRQVACQLVGDDSWRNPTVARIPTYKPKITDLKLCVAFWQDFFTNLCPSPKEGMFLFPT